MAANCRSVLPIALLVLATACQGRGGTGTPILPAHADRECRPYVEEALAERGIAPAEIRAVSYDPYYPVGAFRGTTDEPIGYRAWVRLASCEVGHAIIDLSPTCRVTCVSGRGDCAADAVAHPATCF